MSRRRRVGAGVATLGLAAAAVVGTGVTFSSFGADGTPAFSGLVLGVGDDETSRTLDWYSSTSPAGGEVVELATKADFSDEVNVAATLAANITTDSATALALTNFNGKATLSGLKADTTYYYRVAQKGSTSHSSAYSFTTGAFGNGNFQFLFFGDPQIGASGDPAADGNGWQYTLDQSKIQSPKAELYVSGGDQVDAANNETQWDNFLRPDELRSIPWAATIGNHDNGGIAYDQHFALPDTKRNDANLYDTNTNAPSATAHPGGDYWFKYKGVLFIDLNSNAYSSANGSDPAHVQFVTDTITNHKGDAKHVVLVYHHSIYSPADHANDSDNQQRRTDFTKAFSDLGVDLVLQGHDHSYSRSYAIKGSTASPSGAKADANEKPGQTTVVEGPGGVIYVTANTASGSKYYDLTAPDSSKAGYGADTKVGGDETLNLDGTVSHLRHWANSVENQEHVQTYIEVTVNDKGLQVKNVRANDGSGPNAAIDRGKSTGVGPDLAGSPLPIGSIVDRVDIFRSKADVSPILPPAVTRTVEVPGATTTVTASPQPAPTVTVTATPKPTEVVPAQLQQSVGEKIATLKKKIKKAKGAKKAKLKAQLSAYKAIQKQLK
ncbi:purple acid phosphatase family protein [Nocardioides sp. Iso805N]|uniref:purple acid phosphatase family protein n=1 Tax=Nocardioides sp. Iso805N TaxID=1283287 RepID=UPI0012F94E65|nr:metallophosphoesterase family protein [Nocardioides sp. Iso805N]